MGVLCCPRFDELLERAGAAWHARAEAITELAQLANDAVAIGAFATVKRPAALRQRAAQHWGIGHGDVGTSHVGVLSVEPNTKASRALAKGGFAALKDVADSLADRRVSRPPAT
jgi:hypothetical protein